MQRWKTHNSLKRTLTKFLDNRNLKWDEFLPFTCYCYNIFPSSNGTGSPFFLMFGKNLVERYLSHLKNSNRYYGSNQGKIIMEELHKLWKHHPNYLRKMHQRDEHLDHQIGNNNPKFEVDQPVMVKNHACHSFE